MLFIVPKPSQWRSNKQELMTCMPTSVVVKHGFWSLGGRGCYVIVESLGLGFSNRFRRSVEVEVVWRLDSGWFKHRYHSDLSMNLNLKFEVEFGEKLNFTQCSSAGSTLRDVEEWRLLPWCRDILFIKVWEDIIWYSCGLNCVGSKPRRRLLGLCLVPRVYRISPFGYPMIGFRVKGIMVILPGLFWRLRK